MSLIHDISLAISAAIGEKFLAKNMQAQAGGCINDAFHITDGAKHFFVKTNSIDKQAMFAAEAAGLAALSASASLRVPAFICAGSSGDLAFLVLEYIALSSGNKRTARLLGEQLAALHRLSAPHFGWQQDNYIGATQQINTWDADWANFYAQHRLHYQLNLPANHIAGLLEPGNCLLAHVVDFFSDYRPRPALLHGDLWGGNWGADSEEQPVIFDPAVYFGDREADIAMTELFGGFPPDFYAAYRAAYALDAGYKVRKQLYNLYHVLNHHHLFGGAYGEQARRIMLQLLAELGA